MAPSEPPEAILRIVVLPEDGPEQTESCSTRKGGDILAGYLDVFLESLVGVSITVVFQGVCSGRSVLAAGFVVDAPLT